MTRAAASAPATILMVILLISDTSGVSAVSLKERHEVVDTVEGVGNGPLGVAVNPVTNLVYVANSLDDTVTVIDGSTNEVIEAVTVGNGPYGVAVNPNTNRIYAANYFSNTVTVIDGSTNEVIEAVTVGNGP